MKPVKILLLAVAMLVVADLAMHFHKFRHNMGDE